LPCGSNTPFLRVTVTRAFMGNLSMSEVFKKMRNYKNEEISCGNHH
jgi:hypothetical protein